MSVPPLSILVTGASSGIGQALARRLAADGHAVTAIGRRADRLAALAADGIAVEALDVTDRATLPPFIDRLRPDVVVCAAAVVHFGGLGGSPVADQDSQVATNLVAVLDLVRLSVPHMRARRRGHVVIVSSQSGHYPLPDQTVYATTKAALGMLVSQLRMELLGTPIRVTEIIPGRTRTEIFNEAAGDAAEASRRYFEGVEPLEPAEVADVIRFAIAAPRNVNITRLEVLPVGQAPGGLSMVPVEWED